MTAAPTMDQVRHELARERHQTRFLSALLSTLSSLVVVAAAAVIVAMLLMPVLQIAGSSMSETLNDGDIVLTRRGGAFQTGDVIAFYYNNTLLVKRVIATGGQWVDIGEDGTVLVDGVALSEPYLTDKAAGTCDIDLPYQVPEGHVFVMGDHRSVSVDSRSTAMGCIGDEAVVGKLLLRVWPLSSWGLVE